MKGMPSSSASCWPRSTETARFSSQSHLLPIKILFTPSVACCSTLENQVRMSAWYQYLQLAAYRCKKLTVERALVRNIID